MKYLIKFATEKEEVYFKGIDNKNVFLEFNLSDALFIDTRNDAINLVSMLAKVVKRRNIQGVTSILVKKYVRGHEFTEYTKIILRKGDHE